MLFLPLLMLATTPPVAPPPPPVIITAPSPPPPMIRVPKPGVTQTVAVQIRQDGHLLWAGDLRRSSNGAANYSEQQRETRACPANNDRNRGWNGNGSITTGLTFSIGPDFGVQDDAVRISVERTRPYGDDGVCGGDDGTSTVRFATGARLIKGQPVTVSGEGGLSITLTLR